MRNWFNPKGHTNWHKNDSPETRRRNILLSLKKIKDRRKRYLEAGRKLQALANVTQDDQTHRRAQTDAKYFFNKIKKMRKK